MATYALDHEIRFIEINDPAEYIAPEAVDCGFVCFPIHLSKQISDDSSRKALLADKTELWKEVVRLNSKVPIYRMAFVGGDSLSHFDLCKQLDKFDKYEGHSIAVGVMQMSLDSGEKWNIQVGFAWMSSDPRLFLAWPQKILPKTVGSQQKSARPFWRWF
jgi:hypothetical protein